MIPFRWTGWSDSDAPESSAGLAGLYRSGSGEHDNRICIVKRAGALQFGLVVWGSGASSCSGSGVVNGPPDAPRFQMAGDSPCTIKAARKGGRITFASGLPPGCSYYCSPKASLAGAALAQVSSRRDQALRAKDLVGEPLCASG